MGTARIFIANFQSFPFITFQLSLPNRYSTADIQSGKPLDNSLKISQDLSKAMSVEEINLKLAEDLKEHMDVSKAGVNRASEDPGVRGKAIR